MGFPAKNDHFGVFWWYHHLRKHPFIYIYNPQRKAIYIYPGSLPSKNCRSFWMMMNLYQKQMVKLGNQPIKNGGWTSRVCMPDILPIG